MTLNRRSTLDGQTDLTRLAVVCISVPVNGHRGWKTFAFATDGMGEEKSCEAAAMLMVATTMQKI